MLKQTLLVGAIALAASGAAMADGFYVGAGVGASSFHDKVTVASVEADSGAFGAVGSLLGGYTFSFANQFNLGLEAFGNATSDKINEFVSGTDLKARYQYGVRVVPAYQVTPDTDFHALVGYVRGNFKQDVTGTTGDSTFNKNGYQLGLGTSTNVAKNVALRGDVVYSGFSKQDVDSVSQKLSLLDAVVSVAYKFG